MNSETNACLAVQYAPKLWKKAPRLIWAGCIFVGLLGCEDGSAIGRDAVCLEGASACESDTGRTSLVDLGRMDMGILVRRDGAVAIDDEDAALCRDSGDACVMVADGSLNEDAAWVDPEAGDGHRNDQGATGVSEFGFSADSPDTGGSLDARATDRDTVDAVATNVTRQDTGSIDDATMEDEEQPDQRTANEGQPAQGTADEVLPDQWVVNEMGLNPMQDAVVPVDMGSADSCRDGLLNGSETDVDCGGRCRLCTVGDACLLGSDCLSTLCDAGRCTVITECGSAEYEAEPPGPNRDRVCRALKVCESWEFEAVAPTETSDRVCDVVNLVPGVIQAVQENAEGRTKVELSSEEWLEFEISVAVSSVYLFTFFVESPLLGRRMNVYVDNMAIALDILVPIETDHVALPPIDLSPGVHKVRIGVHPFDGVRLDRFEVAEVDCTDNDDDGYCQERGEDCLDHVSDCFKGVCCRALVGAWHFEDLLGGQVQDQSVYGNIGILTSTLETNTAEGVVGNGLLMDATTQVEVPYDPVLNVGSQYTLSAWVRLNENADTRLFSLRSGMDAWMLISNRRIQFRGSHTASSNWTAYRIDGRRTLELNQWHHLAFVADGDMLRIYVDGVLDAGGRVAPYEVQGEDRSLLMGCLPGTPPNWIACSGLSGELDEVRLYAEPLNELEVAELFLSAPDFQTECTDGQDNDADGRTDLYDDPVCIDPWTDREMTNSVPPDAPTNLRLVMSLAGIVHFDWDPPEMASNVAGYHLYRNGERIDTVMRNTYYDTKFSHDERRGYAVTAFDTSGNESTRSSELLVNVLDWPNQTPSETIFVEPGSYNGFPSLPALVAGSSEGTRFVLGAGTYRLRSPIVPRARQSLIGMPGAILSGAIRAGPDEIVQENGLYKWEGHSIGDGTCHEPGFCIVNDGVDCNPSLSCNDLPLACRACRFRHDLFVDDKVLKRVLAKGEVTQGTFFVDYAGSGNGATIWLSDNYADRRVELSVTRNAISGTPNTPDCSPDCNAYVTVAGLVIEKFATVAQRGAIMAKEYNYMGLAMRHWTIAQNEIRFNHGFGVYAGSHARLINNYIHHNGHMGGSVGDRSLMAGNEFHDNNWAGYQPEWSAGASKVVFSDYSVIQGNYAHDNLGHGLWVDIDNEHIVMEDNIVSNNAGDGIKYEISYTCVIRRNRGLGNHNPRSAHAMSGSAILIQNSEDCEVYDNDVEVGALGNGINIMDQERSYNGVSHVGIGNIIHRNRTVFKEARGRSGYTNADNRFDYNLYVMPEAFSEYFGKTWAEFRDQGQEHNGQRFVGVGGIAPPSSALAVDFSAETSSVCGDFVPLSVNVTAPSDDPVAVVAFFVDGLKIGQTSMKPHSVHWYYPQIGIHNLTAVATSMRGHVVTAQQPVTVRGPCP